MKKSNYFIFILLTLSFSQIVVQEVASKEYADNYKKGRNAHNACDRLVSE